MALMMGHNSTALLYQFTLLLIYRRWQNIKAVFFNLVCRSPDFFVLPEYGDKYKRHLST